MLDFVLELERISTKWPDSIKWTLNQISDYTRTSLPQVVDCLSEALDREIDLQEAITLDEAKQALTVMKRRLSTQLAARERQIKDQQDRAIKAYDQMMEKVRVLMATKNWHGAYRTVSYFLGKFEKDLSLDHVMNVCGDCVRLGLKAQVNMQELGVCLRKGVQAAITAGTPDGMADAFDFLNTYSESFMSPTVKGGDRLINNVIETLREPAHNLGMSTQFFELSKELQKTAS